jgi:hypothetical protein
MSFNNNELAHIILTWNTFQVKIFTALLNSGTAYLLCEILIVERRTQIARLSCYIIEARVRRHFETSAWCTSGNIHFDVTKAAK